MTPAYAAFLAAKTPIVAPAGMDTLPALAPHLFPHQRACVEFALRVGRCGLFLDTGLGKTLCELEFAKHAAAATSGRALILTPLAVAAQIVAEGVRFGYDVQQVREAGDLGPGINVCNYDRLDRLGDAAFGAVVLDESSILKSFAGKTTRALIDRFRDTPFRMAATATPAPNDHMELGTHAEFLGVMQRMEMLARWFVNDTSEASQKWRLKGHATAAFWDWVTSWARMAQNPADLGFDGSAWDLPALDIHRHRIANAGDMRAPAGELFAGMVSATTLHDMKRQTAESRAAAVAGLIMGNDRPWIVWCDTDYEADALLAAIPGAAEVRGALAPERKESLFAAFASGALRVLVTKPSIAGYGLNWQHCADVAFVGRSFSYEAWYQAVRRCWRFGQQKPVQVHLIVAEGEDQIGRVIGRKADDHAAMKTAMTAAMSRARETSSARVSYQPKHDGRMPSWLSAA